MKQNISLIILNMSSEIGKFILSTLMAILIIIVIIASTCLIKKIIKKSPKNNVVSSPIISTDTKEKLQILLLERIVWIKLYIDSLIFHSSKIHTDALHNKISNNSEQLSKYLRKYLDAQNGASFNELLTEQLELISNILEHSVVDEKIDEYVKDLNDNTNDMAKVFVSINPNVLVYDKVQRLFKKQSDYLMEQITSGIEKDWKKNVDVFQKYYDTTLNLIDEF